MKKTIFLAILVSSALSFAQQKSHRNLANLKGNVKVSSIVDYKATPDGKKGEEKGYTHSVFNDKGYITDMNFKNEMISLKVQSKYDATGEKLQESLAHSPQGELLNKNTLKYDERGFRIQEDVAMADGSVAQQLFFKHDDKGFEIEKKVCFSGGFQCLQKMVMDYDANGNLLTDTRYDGMNGKRAEKLIYKYDSQNNKTDLGVYNDKDELLERYTYKYDSQNNVIEEVIYYPDGSVAETKTTSYQYDSKGNWTLKTESIDGNVETISEQKLEYF